jgi:replication factor C subunit 1
VAKSLGFSLLELNASDNRSKKTIEGLLKDLSTSNSIKHYQDKDASDKHKCVVLMDEVDGVSSNDRGGLGALIMIIKKSLVPIVCIANDRNHPKLKSLLNHCYDLKF